MATSWKYWVITVLREIITLLVTIPFTYISIAFTVPLFLILLFHRQFVIVLAKWRHKTWISTTILGGAAAIDLRNEEKIYSIGYYAEFDQSLNYQGFIDRVEKYLNSNKRPELKCYLDRWLGIHFLVPCKDFEVSDVLSVNLVEDHENCEQILDQFHNAPFAKGDPVWQIGVFPNLKPNVCVISLRTHHGLMDAFSLMSVIIELSDPDPIEDQNFMQALSNITNKYLPKISLCSKLLIVLELVTITPIYSTYKTLKSIQANMWTKPIVSGNIIQSWRCFDLKKLKLIAKRHGQNVFTLFTSILTGAIRAEMEARGDDISVEQDVYLGYILPLPRHPHAKRLTTSATSQLLRLPTSQSDRKQRLLDSVKTFSSIRNPAMMIYAHFYILCLAMVGSVIRFNKHSRYSMTAGWTNVVVFIQDRKIMGQSLLDFREKAGIQRPELPMLYFTLSFKDEFRLMVLADKALFPKENDLENYMNRFEYEINCYDEL